MTLSRKVPPKDTFLSLSGSDLWLKAVQRERAAAAATHAAAAEARV